MISTLSNRVSVTAQITPEDVTALANSGVRVIISHRPDGEEPGQPTAQAISDACAIIGVIFVHAPVRGYPDEAAVKVTAEALEAAGEDQTLMFCRSGMRSTVAWALARRLKGDAPDTLQAAAAGAGYDLSRLVL